MEAILKRVFASYLNFPNSQYSAIVITMRTDLDKGAYSYRDIDLKEFAERLTKELKKAARDVNV